MCNITRLKFSEVYPPNIFYQLPRVPLHYLAAKKFWGYETDLFGGECVVDRSSGGAD